MSAALRAAALALAAAALVAACGGGKDAKEPARGEPVTEGKAPVDPALLAEIAAGLEDVLATMAAITEGAADCKAMAAQLDELFAKSAPLFDLAREQSADPEAARLLTAEMDARAPRVAPLVDRIQQGIARCQTDADVARAIEKMPTF